MGSKTRRLMAFAGAVSLAGFLGTAPAAHAEWKIEGPDGSSIKFGFLMQGRGEYNDVDGGGDSKDMYFRRLRILAGGKINDHWSFFFETDSPNLGKRQADGTKNSGDITMQDFVVTWQPGGDEFMLDVGELLSAVSYNSNQSAITLMATDYGATSFVWSGPLDLKVGRDYGFRARGYLLNDKLEYRASVLEGNRSDADADLRYMGRVMYNFFDPMKGLFYTGTTLGKKHLLSVGASYDTQDDYKAYTIDSFWDQPIGSDGNAFTANVAWSHVDGDNFLPTLPEQDNIFAEAGFYFSDMKLLPFVQYTDQDFDSSSFNDTKKTQLGVGYFFNGYNGTLKLSYAKVDSDGGNDANQWWLQLQAFKF
ncbi:MAG: OprO/OprP family phosphate-selective porin [Planctomycetes bacterium]|nr:OprO/OprP family phosphate-selective porin [Planctomycetota bacterium]